MTTEEGLPKLLSEILCGFKGMKEHIEKCSDLLYEEAVSIRDDFRHSRDEFKKSEGRHIYWVHDVRVKKTKNGICVEWFFYKSRRGDFSISESIASEGELQIPPSSFKKCSRYEKKCIKDAEERFFKLRQITRHLSSMSLGHSSLSQMKSAAYNKIVDDSNPLVGICPPECGCELPCDSLLRAQAIYGWGMIFHD
ncbi:conjugative transfer protein MobI(A/C) [Halomonas sp. Bachu 37]|uniref:conjugative transfer protein MobI(A/C) n=1 Tax=Halomonas kashgarensis TaxID=3084920 RepID=UPI003216890B